MQRFQKIVVGVDLGAQARALTLGSRCAAERARWLARRCGGAITLVHSTAAAEYWEASERSFVLGREGIDAEGEQVLEALAEDLRREDVQVGLARSDEHAWLALVREVLRQGADLLVAGKRTDAEGDERRLGSVARKLLRKAPCAVWLEDPRRPEPPRTLLAATDLTAVGRRVLEVGASLAGELDAALHVVHAFSLPMAVQMEGGEVASGYVRDTTDRAREEIQRSLAGIPGGDRAELHIGLTSPTRAILGLAERIAPDLVVMGTVSRGGVPGFLVGNTAERLFDRLDCALLTLKPEDFICPVTLG